MHLRARHVGLALAAIATLEGAALAKAPTNARLIVGVTQEFETLNPILSSMVASTYLVGLTNRPLAAIDQQWSWTCMGCERLPSFDNGRARWVEKDGKKRLLVEWRLQKGQVWGDGTPLTAKDYALRIEIGKAPNVEIPSRDLYDNIESVALDPKDPLKFTLTHKEGRYDFYQLSIAPLPSHIEGPIWEKTKGEMGAYEKQTAYVTNPTLAGLYSGPYVVSEMKLGSHVIFTRNPHFSGEKPKIESLVYKLIPNTQSLEASLVSGDIDMVGELGFTFDQAVQFERRLARDPALERLYKVLFRQGLTYEHVDFNLRNPILQDPRVRKALAYGVDREKMVKALFDGRQPVAHSNIHPLDPYYADDTPKYPYDPDKARAILEEAGWKVGSDGIRVKDGRRLELSIMTTSQNKTRELVQVFLQQEWRKIGVAVPIKNEPARVFFAETMKKAAFPALAMYAWVSSPDSPPKSTLHSKEIPTKENSFTGQNYPGWANKRADELLDQVFVEFDAAKRKAMMAELQKIYAEELPALPLYLRSEIAVVPANLTGYALSGHQFFSSLWAEKWSLGGQAAH